MRWVLTCLWALPFFLALIQVAWSQATVLLLPQTAPVLGEVSRGMGGAQTALVNATEALAINPAGLGLETGTTLSASTDVIRWQQLNAGRSSTQFMQAAPGMLSTAMALRETPGFPYFALGAALYGGESQQTQVSFREKRTVPVTGLPTSLGGGVVTEQQFPDGLTLIDHSSGSARLASVHASFGLGVAASAGLRLGIALDFERLQMVQQSTSFHDYSQPTAGDDGSRFTGFSQTSAHYEGQLNRMAYRWGLQWRIFSWLAAGLSMRLPSIPLGREGRARIERLSTLHVADLGLEVLDGSKRIAARENDLDFQLRQPQETRLGIALPSDTAIIELDAIQTEAEPAYEVFPGLESGADSTAAARFGPLTTSSKKTTRYALGLAFAQGGDRVLLLGANVSPSPVPRDDAVFRHMDLAGVNVGFGYGNGPYSGSLGLEMQVAGPARVRYPVTGEDATLTQSTTLRSLGINLSGSVVF